MKRLPSILEGPIVKVLPDGWVHEFTASGLKLIETVLVCPLGAVNVADPLSKLKPWVMQPEPSQRFGPDFALRFPLPSAVAVRVGQLMIMGEPDAGVSVKVQVRLSRSPGVRDPSVVV
jgi:hypothetical protein